MIRVLQEQKNNLVISLLRFSPGASGGKLIFITIFNLKQLRCLIEPHAATSVWKEGAREGQPPGEKEKKPGNPEQAQKHC